MESTKHPDQNPEEVQALKQEEKSQQENAVNTVEESSSIENVVAETEVPAETTEAEVTAEIETAVIEEPVQTDEVAESVALSEPEVVSEPEVIAEAEVTAENELVPEPEVSAEAETIPEPEVVAEPEAVAEVEHVQEPEVVVTAEIAPEAKAVPEATSAKEQTDPETTEEAEAIDEVIEAEVAAAESVDIDYGHMDREQLVALLEETVQNEDVNEIKSKVAQIKVAYLALANKERQELYQNAAASEEAENFEVVDPLEERFKAAFGIYKHNKFRFTEDQEKIKVQNLEAKKKILDELKVLINSEETLKKTYDEFKALQETWKGIGMVPKTEAQGLWQNYHFLIEKFFDKVKINKELKDLDLRKNLERKIELCEKAEELVLEPSITQSFKRLQELHEEWKEVGPVAQDKREEVWDRFKTATEKINDRRHEFYKQIQGDLEANHAAKVLLCEKAEQLVATEFNSIKQWQDSTHQVNELLKMWKSVGQAPQKVNNEIWNRFKAQLDLYFSNKKEYFGKLKDQQLNNYNLKVELCLQAESHKLSTDWKNSSRELIKLQEEWKQIGPVPRKHSEKIWKRFRTACDEFFNTKNEYFKGLQASEGGNLQIKLDIINKLTAFEYSDNRQESLAKVKELQRQWMDTGHVPIKEKDRIQAEFKAATNKIYDKLKVDSQEASQMSYRSRFENTKDQPDAGRIINRERNGLQFKIDSLKEEILLWENNIGFFARSKQANLLKAEFEAKIAHAKEELASLEAKAKILRNVARDQQ
ncbi:MAG: DUF349 domain-containing protein [Bacteroidales bacterium]|nr:DUF349 domain-containing protein [Bacteroidales bacterium]